MARQPPALNMNTIIANDAPLLSPAHDAWDHVFPASTADGYPFNSYYAPLSPSSSPEDSPLPASRMLKMRRSPDAQSEQESLCISTNQVFDLAETQPAQSPPPTVAPILIERSSSVLPTLAPPTASSASKRSASPAPSAVCKKRATAERVASKDFVPPDVTGLSKREARLVKNRAAAFLSRQRKREEFETMEIRVAELEQENARLLALTQSGSVNHLPQQASEPALKSEVEQLKAQLAAAKERERQLAAKLVSSSSQETVSIKQEASEICVPSSSSSRAASPPSANKTAAGLGLMVLLCALPSLLASVQLQTGAQTSFSVPSPFPSSAAKYSFDSILPSDFDWTRSSLINLDSEDRARFSPSASLPRKLEFADVDTSELGDLNGLDISFDTSSTDNGKIRVRIHPSSSASSRAASPGASSSSSKSDISSPLNDLWSSDSESNFRSSFSSQGSPSIAPLTPSSLDPFLGDYSMTDSFRMNDLDDGMSDFGLGSEYSVPDSTGAKRRVRIALKSPPSSTSEGGEWEVEIC